MDSWGISYFASVSVAGRWLDKRWFCSEKEKPQMIAQMGLLSTKAASAYRTNDNTNCEVELACANIAVPVCCST